MLVSPCVCIRTFFRIVTIVEYLPFLDSVGAAKEQRDIEISRVLTVGHPSDRLQVFIVPSFTLSPQKKFENS